MQYDTGPTERQIDAYMNRSLHDAIEFMKEQINLTSIEHERSIRRLATALSTILVEKKHQNKLGQSVSLWSYTFGNLPVPRVLCLDDVFSGAWDYLEKAGFGTQEEANQAIFFASSLRMSDGAYKPIIVNKGKFSLDEFLKTKILRLPNGQGGGFDDFSIGEIVCLMRNKETSHVESKFNPNDKFWRLEKFHQRYLIILGLVEYIIAVSEIYTKQSTAWFIQVDIETSYVRIKSYTADPAGESLPSFFFEGAYGMPGVCSGFDLFRELRTGEKFHIATIGNISFYVNDERNYVLDVGEDEPIVMPCKCRVGPRDSNKFRTLYTTLRFFHSFQNYWAVLDATDFTGGEREIDDLFLCYVMEFRANAWLKLGNVERSKKIYLRLLDLDVVRRHQEFESHIVGLLKRIQG